MVIRRGILTVLFLSIVFSSSLASPEEIHFSERTKSRIFFHEGSEVTFDVEGEGDLSKVLITIERGGKVYASNLTNREGSAKLNLPLVNSSSPFLVKAKRNGLKDEFTIWILDTPRLYISVKRIYLEGDEIKVKVIDDSAKPVEGAGLDMPKQIGDPKDIDRPVIVKYHGAKGGKGFFIAKTYEEFEKLVDWSKPFTIQEFVMGTRYYLHYFYSPIREDGYKLSKGSLQLLSMDRRDETTIDELQRIGSISELEEIGIHPTFVVTGNIPIVIRESLLPEVFRMGERIVEKSIELFGGVIGPFCLETVVTEDLKFKVFEISARIVAGTNPYISGSPYSDLIQPDLSTGRRIAQEIKYAQKHDLLEEILS